MDVPRPPGDDANGDRLAQLTELLSTDSFATFLADLVALAHAETAHRCSITVQTENQPPFTAVATDELIQRLDGAQYDAGAGPCLEALSSRVPVLVTDLTTESRWTPYRSRALELGVRSSMSYPLITGDDVIGALNLYAFEPLTPDVGLEARAAQLADRAAGALALGLRIAADRSDNANLRAALASRSVIDQAIGILVAQQRCSVEEAFALLRQTSQTRNIKLRDVAVQIVASAQRRQPGKPSGRY